MKLFVENIIILLAEPHVGGACTHSGNQMKSNYAVRSLCFCSTFLLQDLFQLNTELYFPTYC